MDFFRSGFHPCRDKNLQLIFRVYNLIFEILLVDAADTCSDPAPALPLTDSPTTPHPRILTLLATTRPVGWCLDLAFTVCTSKFYLQPLRSGPHDLAYVGATCSRAQRLRYITC